MKVTALVPIKTLSERLPGKNFLAFDGQPLYQIVLDKLETINLIDKIVINTDSEIIRDDCLKRYSKSTLMDRPANMRGNEITMNTIIEHDISKSDGEHFLQTHCTNPLMSAPTIVRAIHCYFENLDKYDSLFSVQSIHKRVYSDSGVAINHSNLKLEQTQNLTPVFIENSNIFLFSRTSFFSAGRSRVGKKPQLFPMSSIEGIDIDYAEDFILAELIRKNKALFNELD